MERERFCEDYDAGEARQTLGRTITKTDIVVNAGRSEDFFPPHVDAEFCRTQPLGTQIAYGIVTFTTGIGLTATEINLRASGYGRDRLRFTAPALAGDTLRSTVTIKGKDLETKQSAAVG